jgi:hypothetical protein
MVGALRFTHPRSWSLGVVLSAAGPQRHYAIAVAISDATLTVDLSDGRTIAAPVAWYPRLAHGTTVSL